METLHLHGMCNSESVLCGNTYRFSFLTSQLIRLEYSETGRFEDHATQFAINRKFPPVPYSIHNTANSLDVDTEFVSICYDKKPFSPGGLSIKVRSPCKGIYSTWHFGDTLNENLGGTARTLDQADGAISLENGLLSRLQGYSVIDDSHSLLIYEDGHVAPRTENTYDLYFFAYGYAYEKCLKDYFQLTGSVPLLPRYALGNWWSRFHAYSEEEYLELFNRFQQEKVPFSVAVLDMDWHITNVNSRYGKGWTGYSWNRQLFPDPARFLSKIHLRDLKVTLNLHPAEGIQPFEDQYDYACEMLGRESSEKLPIHFDFCDKHFIQAYFECLLHPEEQRGVDFWWIDWQQGNFSRFSGGDPLWLLNHYHFLDSGKGGKRAFIFSRYAGPGSHRYPIGFSGDSVISWASLQFQPYFTATASNIGYGWWSHDIGGHCGGKRDEELLVRWIQFGVFSPIMRLHSTSNLFNGKEPWNYSKPAAEIMKHFLRLRHRLIPYLYAMNWQYAMNGQLPIRPMYYHYPEADSAYDVPNQYEFGSDMIVCPITSPTIPELKLGKVVAWLPEIDCYDFFSGIFYHGKRKVTLYRNIESIPVLVKAGAIIPLAGAEESCQNGVNLPEEIVLNVFARCNGQYDLYEDDGCTNECKNGKYTETHYEVLWDSCEDTVVSITPSGYSAELLPANRRYTIKFNGIDSVETVSYSTNRQENKTPLTFEANGNYVLFSLPACGSSTSIKISMRHPHLASNNTTKRIYDLLMPMEIGYEIKQQIYECIAHAHGADHAFGELQTMDLPNDLLGAIAELLFA